MRIYLACTVRGDRGTVEAARRISRGLARLGHEVLTGHLLEEDVEQAEARLTDTAIFTRDIEWLDRCDALVAEASGSSFGVGFEVGYVLARAPATRQKAFLLYDASRRSSISRIIPGIVHPACRILPYHSIDEIDALLASTVGPA
jgi:nucleoside 2-deoxyribosyltransferase